MMSDQDHDDNDVNEYRLVRDVVLSGLVRQSIGRSPLSPSWNCVDFDCCPKNLLSSKNTTVLFLTCSSFLFT